MLGCLYMRIFIEKMKEVLEREDVDMQDVFRDYEEWDSVCLLSLMVVLEDDYDLIISKEEFEKIKTIEDLYNYITK